MNNGIRTASFCRLNPTLVSTSWAALHIAPLHVLLGLLFKSFPNLNRVYTLINSRTLYSNSKRITSDDWTQWKETPLCRLVDRMPSSRLKWRKHEGILNGLASSSRPFHTAFNMRSKPMSMDDSVGALLQGETNQNDVNQGLLPLPQPTANVSAPSYVHRFNCQHHHTKFS